MKPSLERSRRSDDNNFDFKVLCLFCGNICADNGACHPNRLRQVIKCRTVKRKPKKSLKDVILSLGNLRSDKWSNDVKQRFQSAVSDLYAVNTWYHKSCMTKFSYISTSGKNEQEDHNQAFSDILTFMEQNKSTIWNSIEIYEIYKSKGGFTFSRKVLTKKLSRYLDINVRHLGIWQGWNKI